MCFGPYFWRVGSYILRAKSAFSCSETLSPRILRQPLYGKFLIFLDSAFKMYGWGPYLTSTKLGSLGASRPRCFLDSAFD